MNSPLTRADLERIPRARLGKLSALKPDVWLVEVPGGHVVVKDASARRGPARLIARWLLGRERRVLERIAGVEGVPALLGRIDRDAIALSLVPGRTLDREIFRARPRELVAQLQTLIGRLHERGVFHLDLHQRKNVLVDASGRLRVIDFGAAIALGPVGRALLGPLLRPSDRQAPYKFLAQYAPDELTPDEARAVVWQRRVRRLWPFTRPGRVDIETARERQVR